MDHPYDVDELHHALQASVDAVEPDFSAPGPRAEVGRHAQLLARNAGIALPLRQHALPPGPHVIVAAGADAGL
eukprot:15465131-Alexandrium_andersonii.AAC.1